MNKRKLTSSTCGAAMFLVLLAAVSAGGYEKEIEQLSAAMAEKITAKGKQTVAVVDFTDLQGNVTELDRFIAEEFSVALAGAGKGFRVIDRTNLNSIIKENKLSATGLIDPATARKLGKIAGVDALVTGTLTPFGDNVRVTIKVLDSDTADIIDAAKGNFAKTQAIEELLGKDIAQENPAIEGTTTAAKKTDKGYAIQEAKGFTFNMKECKKSGDFITCSLSIISNNQDRVIKTYANGHCDGSGSTVIYDNIGNEYAASKISLGEEVTSCYITRRLVAGVPTTASFEFKGINQDASAVSLLEIQCLDEGEWFAVQFRNIPISK